ncbi:MAG TPA: peptide ABC transporter substrate-binding protein [Gemmatimonadaceae bacterium]|jgi:peptide/nickel transport system substrate-binding protein|nr:peptide ABC transporter substrate-binding protein [Gemmatimonadaceae bacterium]
MRGTTVTLLGLLITGCSERVTDKNSLGENGGTIVISTPQDPGTLFPPFVESTSAKQITEQIYDYLADVGPSLDTRNEKDYRRELAESWRWSGDSLSLEFHLNPRARWHDGRRVTAGDVRFTYQLNKNPAVAGRYASSLENIDSVTVTDSLTPVFWFHRRQPSQFLDAAAQLLILPAHQLEKISPQQLRDSVPPLPIGSGRFRLRRWDRGESVEIVPDTTNYRGRPRLDRVIWSVAPEFATAITRLKRGDIDLLDGLRPENLSELAGRPGVRLMAAPTMDYAFLRFNLRDPTNRFRPHRLFGDRELRRAIAMSIDRKSLVKSVLDTLGVVPAGPTVRSFPSTDSTLTQVPFDSARAAAILDSLGWTRHADGFRARNGKELSFKLIVPSYSPNRVKMGVLIQEKLRQAGIRVHIEKMELVAQVSKEAKADFDASLDNWTLHASPDATREAWGTAGIGEKGVNYGSYSNPRFDALLDTALMADPAQARARFSAAYAVINDDAPAVWLYEPRKIIGVNSRIRMAEMRPDAWWFSLPDWYVPASGRIPRDQAPPKS